MAIKKYRKALLYLDVCWEKEDIDEREPFNFVKVIPPFFCNFSD